MSKPQEKQKQGKTKLIIAIDCSMKMEKNDIIEAVRDQIVDLVNIMAIDTSDELSFQLELVLFWQHNVNI